MVKVQKLFELEIQKEKIFIEDFNRILLDFDDGDQCVLDFSKMHQFDPSAEPFRIVLEQMITKSGNLVLLGPECFEQLVNGIDSQKFHFILKSFTTANLDLGESWEELVNKISEDFFEHYFTLNKPHALCQIDPYAVASIEIIDGEKKYELGLVMNEKTLHTAISKVLLIPVDPSFGDCKDLAAELLNMMCGHLRTRLKQKKYDVVMGIPKCILTKFCYPPNNGKYWIFQDNENQMGLFLKEVDHVCI
ncbi:MAG: hypothetical protein WA160_11315 [Pseudobdellovibrio sp.]